MIVFEKMSEEFSKFHLNSKGEEPWPFRPVLHHFTAPDKGGPHDHPWGFTSYVLKGGYVERVYEIDDNGLWTSKLIHRKPGSVHKVSAEHIHELVELPEGECWTMVIQEPWKREPRFWKFEQDSVFSRQHNEAEFVPFELAW